MAVQLEEVPRSWASNEPFAEQHRMIGTPSDQIIPSGSPTKPDRTLEQMKPEQVVIVAMFELPAMTPAPACNPNFPEATSPLTLSAFERQERWEGQPSGTPLRYRGLFRVNDQYLTVDVYFGISDPDGGTLDDVRRELDRLTVPNG